MAKPLLKISWSFDWVSAGMFQCIRFQTTLFILIGQECYQSWKRSCSLSRTFNRLLAKISWHKTIWLSCRLREEMWPNHCWNNLAVLSRCYSTIHTPLFEIGWIVISLSSNSVTQTFACQRFVTCRGWRILLYKTNIDAPFWSKSKRQ